MDDEMRCLEYSINVQNVELAQKNMPPEEVLNELSRMFSAFAETNRLKILLAVLERELCVCELGKLLEMSAPAVSHHLRRLKDLGLIKTRRQGKLVYYSLDDDHIRDILMIGRSHLAHRFIE